MSASNKKKLRKEQEAVILTEKQQKEKADAKKLKIYSITFAVAMILIVCIAIGTIAYTNINKTGILHKNTVALTVGEHKLHTTDLSYFFVDAINSQYSQWYQTYGDYTDAMVQMMLGLNPASPLDAQYYNEEANMTWGDYFAAIAVENAAGAYAVYDAAMADGFTLTEEEQTTMNENIQVMQDYADIFAAGDVDSYIAQSYGLGSTMETYRNYVEVMTIVNAYQQQYYDSLTYDDAAVRAYEASHYNDFTGYTFAYKFIDYTAFLGEGTTDEDGNVTYTDAENEAALEEAKKTAESLTAAQSVEQFDEMISALEIYAPEGGTTGDKTVSTKSEDTLLTSILEAIRPWISDAARKDGDTTVLPYESTATDADGNETTSITGYFAVYFQNADEHLEPLANVRHLLVKFEGGTTDASGYTTYSDEEKAAAKKEADELLETWKKGEATEESFIALVKEHSDDSSAEDGGLFTDIRPDSSYVPNFLNWSIDPAREAGDAEVIESEYGYHVMFYVGDSETTYRDSLIRDTLLSNDYTAWITEIENSVEPVLGNLKRLPYSYIISSTSY